jgi:hypothetical protein
MVPAVSTTGSRMERKRPTRAVMKPSVMPTTQEMANAISTFDAV